MKRYLLTLFLFFSLSVFAQKKLPVVKAVSASARIIEGSNRPVAWNITPEAKPDVYVTNKLTSSTPVKFVTDTDSVVFSMKPGLRKDFIVLLNGKDSCYTSIQSPALKDFSNVRPRIHDTIPFIINEQNTIYIKAVLNGIDTLNLNFDTGTTELVLTTETLKSKITSDVKLYNTPYELKIGNKSYTTKVYDAERTGHDTQGRFGWDLFDGMVVELNYDKNVMVVHSEMPRKAKKDKAYTKLGIRYSGQVFLTEAAMAQSGTENTDWFLFDTGYQRTAMLDNDLLKQNGFPADKMEVIKKVIMYGAAGNEVPVITSSLETLGLGKYSLHNVPAQLLTNSKPVRDTNIHILGNEVLKRFNIFLDFHENVVYLKPNRHYNDGYIDRG